MNKTGRLSDKDHAIACALTPFVCIDFIVSRPLDSKYLVGLRTNSPAKGKYFVPGGRVYKGETLTDARNRIMHTEFGCTLSNIEFHGIYDHYYTGDNPMDIPDIDTHIIVLAFRAKIPLNIDTSHALFTQHSDIDWLTSSEILESKNVHMYTKYYFVDNPNNRFI